MFWSVLSVLCAAIKLARLWPPVPRPAARQLRQRADLHALPVLVELGLGEIERLLLHLHVFLRVNQFIVGVLDGGDGGDDLQAQALLGIFQPVFGDANRQPRVVNPEISQQRLGELHPDGAAGIVKVCGKKSHIVPRYCR